MEKLEAEPIKTHIALGILTNSKGEVLVIQRKKKDKGTGDVTLNWAFPGGKVEDNEKEMDAAEREVLEETGYVVKGEKEISSRAHPQFPVFVHYISCKLTDEQSVKVTDGEIEQVKWVKLDELKSYFTTDFDKKVQDYLGLK